jgi:hypothetical protein
MHRPQEAQNKGGTEAMTSKKPRDKRKAVRPKKTAPAFFQTSDVFKEGKRVGFEAGRKSRDKEVAALRASLDLLDLVDGTTERLTADLVAARDTISRHDRAIAGFRQVLEAKNRDLDARNTEIIVLKNQFEVLLRAHNIAIQDADNTKCALNNNKRELERLVTIIEYFEKCFDIVRTVSIL